MDKNALKKFAVWARNELIKKVTLRANLFSINEKTNFASITDFTMANGKILSQVEQKQYKALLSVISKKGFKQTIEEVAYTWFNRFAALRFMEVNAYLPSHIRVFSNENKEFKPQILDEAINLDSNDFPNINMQKVMELKQTNKTEELYKYIIILQCNALNSILPGMFQQIEDYSELLFPDNLLNNDSVIFRLINDISEDDWVGQDTVQIIGWLYQYYNSELKDEVFEGLKKNKKITKENIPAATQLFTPDWIVRYMVENSLGRLWFEGHSNSKLKQNWRYYLDEAEQEPEVKVELEKIREEYKKLKPEEIKCIDPCMGSGHILCYLFDVLYQIYEESGYTARDAVESIIKNNLFGLDIDERAAQLAYFSVMMKARQYDKRFLSRNLQPHVYAIRESNGISQDVIDYFGSQRPLLSAKADTSPNSKALGADLKEAPQECVSIAGGAVTTVTEGVLLKSNLEQSLKNLLDQTKDACEYGSLISVSDIDFNILRARIEEVKADNSYYKPEIINLILPLIEVAQVLAQKYDVVVTNPPYMGNSGMNPTMQDFIKKNYPDFKMDLFSCFVVRCGKFLNEKGFMGFLTPYVWMFLQSYEKLRNHIYSNNTIETLIQFEYSAFEEATVPICTFVLNNYKINKKGNYVRLTDFRGGMEVQRVKYLEAVSNPKCGYFYISSSERYSKIPNSPVAYWLSDKIINHFIKDIKLAEIASPKAGLSTCDNERFLRFWYEIKLEKIDYKFSNVKELDNSTKKWFPMTKGGSFRKWYGNNEYVINFENSGEELKYWITHNPKDPKTTSYSRYIRNYDKYGQKGFSFNDISSESSTFRFQPNGYIPNSRGPFIYSSDFSILAFLNSKVSKELLKLISPTLTFNVGDIAKLPIAFSSFFNNNVDDLVQQNVDISKYDWDSFETSWDFVRHPLVGIQRPLSSFASQKPLPPAKLGADLVDNTKMLPQSFEKTVGGAGEQSETEGVLNNEELAIGNEELKGKPLCQLLLTSPLKKGSIKEAYQQWEKICSERFETLKSNEEELNRIFIDIYGLKDELTPEVEDKDVTVRKADLQRDIKSLLSYAVGCMFGRYSLDVEGLAYAGGEWDSSKYKSFIPNKNNVIPICEDEYFEDDIMSRFVQWLEIVYGKDSLEDNLRFIADAIGGSGPSRNVIRKYFMTDFYTDHLKIYQKRPIYWLFDSGKKNAFKCLIYMHRYQADNIARIRTDYVHAMQAKYRLMLEDYNHQIENSSGSARVKLTKAYNTLNDKAEELRLYEEKIHHLADSMINIDLDDGVKHNYALFESVLAKIK